MGQLRTFELDLEIVTPMMTGGADQRAEVRAPTIRSRLRFWLRALLGGVLGDDLHNVRLVEGAVFGIPARASPIAVRATGDVAAGPLPTDPRSFPGVQYMFWSAYQGRRDCLLPGQDFHLRLQTRPLALPDVEMGGQIVDRDRAFDLTLAALWLSVQLGNAGFRARRGAGGAATRATAPGWPADLPPLPVRAATPGALADDLAQDLGRLRRFVGWDAVAQVAVPTRFSILHPDSFALVVLDRTFPSWWEALDTVGQAFRTFRRRQPDDYQGIKAILTRSRLALHTVKRSIFGLPLPFFFSSLFKTLTEQGVPPAEARARASASVVPQGADRSGSPLFFRVVRLVGDMPSYAVLLGLWRSQLTPNGMLVVRPRDRTLRPVTVPAPVDYSYIEEWFAYLWQNVGQLLPVAYT